MVTVTNTSNYLNVSKLHSFSRSWYSLSIEKFKYTAHLFRVCHIKTRSFVYVRIVKRNAISKILDLIS
jgi:hypothetical protein